MFFFFYIIGNKYLLPIRLIVLRITPIISLERSYPPDTCSKNFCVHLVLQMISRARKRERYFFVPSIFFSSFWRFDADCIELSLSFALLYSWVYMCSDVIWTCNLFWWLCVLFELLSEQYNHKTLVFTNNDHPLFILISTFVYIQYKIVTFFSFNINKYSFIA